MSNKGKKSDGKKSLPAPSPKKRFFSKMWEKLKNSINLISGVGGVAGLVILIVQLCTPHNQKVEDDEVYKGELKPKKIANTNNRTQNEGHLIYLADSANTFFYRPSKDNFRLLRGVHITDFNPEDKVFVQVGTTSIGLSPEQLKIGVDIIKTFNLSCIGGYLYMGIYKDRVYVSTAFRSLQNEQALIGQIEYNRWKVYKNNALRPIENDTVLEVRDKQNRIAFGIKYGHGLDAIQDPSFQSIIIQGYFISDTSVAIINASKNNFNPDDFEDINRCISRRQKNWIDTSSFYISKIKSFFGN